MTAESPKIKVNKPAGYFEVPTPPAPNGATSVAPSVEPVTVISPGIGVPTSFRMLGDDPPKDSDSAIVTAIGQIVTVAKARIAYHENALRKLRESLAAVAALTGAPRQPDAPVNSDIGEAIRTLLAKAEQLSEPGQ